MEPFGKKYPTKQVFHEKYQVPDIFTSCAMDDFSNNDFINRFGRRDPEWSDPPNAYEYQCYMSALNLLPIHAFFYLLAATDLYQLVQKAPTILSLPSMFPTKMVDGQTQILLPFQMNFNWYVNRHAMVRALYDFLLVRKHTGFSYIIQTKRKDIQILVSMYGDWECPSSTKWVCLEDAYVLAEGTEAEAIKTIIAKSYPKVDFESSKSLPIVSPTFSAKKRVMFNC